MWAVVPPALAAPSPDRLELVGEAGVYTAQSGFGVGLDGTVRTGRVVLGLSAVAGGRVPFPNDTPISTRDAVGLSTVELDLRVGGVAGHEPIGLVALLDAAFVDPLERDCSRQNGCRSSLFLGSGRAPVGASLQPAAGVRLVKESRDHVLTTLLLGVQPTLFYGDVLLVPRLQVEAWDAEGPWSFRAWTSRYGVGVGLGHALSAPKGRSP